MGISPIPGQSSLVLVAPGVGELVAAEVSMILAWDAGPRKLIEYYVSQVRGGYPGWGTGWHHT